MNRVKIYNGKLITPCGIIEDGSIVIENGKIKCISAENIYTNDCYEINAHGNYISPGFIDIHTHGGGGHDFMDGTVEAYHGAAELHAKHGTTSMVPTTLACSNEELKNTFDVYSQAKNQNKKGANLLGLHLEGPYFSMEQRGAQDRLYIKNPQPDEYKAILQWSNNIIRWSAAPELEGALEFGRFLQKRGILASIAHSNAIDEQVQAAFENGYTHVTHFYSGMSGIRRIKAKRYAGVIESTYLIDDLTVEIIADGVHLPASLLKLIYKIKGPTKTALVTDSMRAAGMPEGQSILGSLEKGQKVIVEEGVAKLPDRSAFAGSVATADRLVRTMIQIADVPLVDSVQMMTSTPATIIGVEKEKGTLVPGKDADIVIFDKEINVQTTMVKGNIVYSMRV